MFVCVAMTYKCHDGVFSQTLTESIDKIDSARYFVALKNGTEKEYLGLKGFHPKKIRRSILNPKK